MKESALDIPGLRPPVLRPATVKALDAYLAFRQRLRNLYLFDLEPTLILPLLGAAPTAWEPVRDDLAAFAAAVEQIAADI